MQTNEIIAIIVSAVVALIGIIAVVYFGDDTGADEDTSTSDSPSDAHGASARLDERVQTFATEVGADLDSINTDLSSQTGVEREAITTIGSVASGAASVPEAPPDVAPMYQHPENQLVIVPEMREALFSSAQWPRRVAEATAKNGAGVAEEFQITVDEARKVILARRFPYDPAFPLVLTHAERQSVERSRAQMMPTLDVRSDGLIQNVATGEIPFEDATRRFAPIGEA